MGPVENGSVEEELNRCLPRVRRYAQYLCGRREDDASDLVQAAVAEWLRRPVNGLPAFVQLRQLVKSRFVDSLRSMRTREMPLSDGHGDCGPNLERMVEVREVLDRLPFEDRYVLWMVYGQGYSVDEVAKEMHVNARTVKRKLARARGKFAAIFGED